MYSEEEKEQISKLDRNNFRKLKQKENKGKVIPVSDDILYISNFNLEVFFYNDKKKYGDSGKLYLATNKYNHKEKYILKHAFYDCACNEYIYSKIGNKMGIKIAPVKLFILDDKKDKFKSDFVCGIKYFENSEHVNYNYIVKNKNNISNWQDYFRMLCLESLFEESDGIEVIKYNDEIYRIDITAAFTISETYIQMLAYDYKANGINIKNFAKKEILRLAKGNTDWRLSSWKHGIDYFLETYDQKYFGYYLETFKLFEKITEKDIEEWVNILTFFYPNMIGEYFKLYFKNLKLDVEQFLINIEKQNLVTV